LSRQRQIVLAIAVCPHALPLRGSLPPKGARFGLGRPGAETVHCGVIIQKSTIVLFLILCWNVILATIGRGGAD